MKVKHLDHLNLKVENLQDSLDWYGRVFGFEVVEEGLRGGKRWAIIRAGEAMLCLYERSGFQAPSSHEELDARRQLGVSHFALRITDEESWRSIVEREQLKLGWDSPVSYPHSTSWYVEDPSGYEIEVAAWHQDQVQFGT